MSGLLDTNVLSELVRPAPDPGVVAWVRSVPDTTLHVSVLSLGELRRGIERLPDSARRERLRVWLEHDLPTWFEGRVLSVDVKVAEVWGRMLARAGRPLPSIDSLLAATALVHGLRVVTRNVRDYADTGVEVFNPWSSGPAG